MSTTSGKAIQPKMAFVPATVTATGTGAVIDMQGYEELTILINIGAFSTFDGTNKWTFTVNEGDVVDDVANPATITDTAAIATADYLTVKNADGSTWDRICDAAGDASTVKEIAVAKTTKRYRTLTLTEAGTVSAIVGAVALLSGARHRPAGVTQTP